MESVIAQKYAVSLLQVAKEQKSVDAVAAEIKAIQKLVDSSEELKNVLEHPRVKPQEKLDALQKVLGMALSPVLENFLRLLITKKRIKHLKEVAEHFEKLCYEMKGKAVARVLTAMALTAEQKDTLSKKLTQIFGLTVDLKEEIKPGLIGGMMIYLGDQRMDGSVLGQLEKMKQRLSRVEID